MKLNTVIVSPVFPTYLFPYSACVLVFWAIRGGGAGSWGVIVSATFRTFPTFTGTASNMVISAKDSAVFGNIMHLHAEHIFDMDDLHPVQYFFATRNVSSKDEIDLQFTTFFPKVTASDATARLQPFLDDVVALGGVISDQVTEEKNFNDAITVQDEVVGDNLFMGSRLFSEDVYRKSPECIGKMYTKLFDAGSTKYGVPFQTVLQRLILPLTSVYGHLVGGGMSISVLRKCPR